MKKVLLSLLTVGLLIAFPACGDTAKNAEKATDKTECAEKSSEKDGCCAEKKDGCCKELTEEQKAEIVAWNDWDNQTPEKKQELVANRKACMDKKIAECKEKCEGKMEECKDKKEQCPEKEAKCAEMKAKWEKWDTLTLEEQKALLDAMAPKKCCKDGQKESCCKEGKKDGCCKDKKDGCCKDGKKEGQCYKPCDGKKAE
ncbi:MAG: hypothetical protein LBH92_04530 [Bacteroidales bacterium]|jgi:hypothetical protein|nr:hypothetical protein [Bacteroidales bacterium]